MFRKRSIGLGLVVVLLTVANMPAAGAADLAATGELNILAAGDKKNAQVDLTEEGRLDWIALDNSGKFKSPAVVDRKIGGDRIAFVESWGLYSGGSSRTLTLRWTDGVETTTREDAAGYSCYTSSDPDKENHLDLRVRVPKGRSRIGLYMRLSKAIFGVKVSDPKTGQEKLLEMDGETTCHYGSQVVYVVTLDVPKETELAVRVVQPRTDPENTENRKVFLGGLNAVTLSAE